MSPRYIIAAGLALALIIGSLAGYQSCQAKRGSAAETQSHIDEGVANAHLNQAQAMLDHAKELAAAQADVDRAWAEVARVKRVLASKPVVSIPDTPGSDQTVITPILPDHRDEAISALDALVSAQGAQIGSLKLALTDKTRQSEEYRLAFEAERRRAVGLEIALDAQKSLVKSSRWQGRIEGFAVGIALGYVEGRR